MRGRSDERDAMLGTRRRQACVLRQEAIAGIDRIRARMQCGTDDLVDGEIRTDRMPRYADLVRLVGLQSVQRVAVLIREYRDRSGPELICRTKCSDRDLTAICDQDFLKHLGTQLSFVEYTLPGQAPSGQAPPSSSTLSVSEGDTSLLSQSVRARCAGPV